MIKQALNKTLFFTLLLGTVKPVVYAQTATQPATLWTEPRTQMVFSSLAGGCFDMGSDQTSAPRDVSVFNRLGIKITIGGDELPKHKVCLKPFWMATHEVTEAQWQMMKQPIAKSDSRLPVRGIRWQDAEAFTNAFSELANDSYLYRLPTEAEWEYACYANQPRVDIRHESDVDKTGWYSKDNRQPVGQLPANGFGLHDMLGNVWEWTSSDYRPYSEAQHSLFHAGFNPAFHKVMRGGSYRTTLDQIGCNRRSHSNVNESLHVTGLRLVRVPRKTP